MTMHGELAVVVATHNRRERLVALLDGLAAQTIGPERFEVVVVDDGSSDGSASVLAAESERNRLTLKVIGRPWPGGPARARDEGWRASDASLVAFTDDDCVPEPEWLEAGLAAAEANPGAIVQGRTRPAPAELDRMGPFSRTIDVPDLDPAFQTCNVFYPREVLERVDGFDIDGFDRAPGGEDSDLAWRAIESGATTAFARDAVVQHAVSDLGPIGKLRVAARWTTPMLSYARHPELRKAHFEVGIFWKGTHYHLVRALAAQRFPGVCASWAPGSRPPIYAWWPSAPGSTE